MRKMRFAAAALLAAAFMFAGNAAFAGEAKVTFNNKTGADVYLALCWPKYESDAADSNAFMWKKGWFKIEPGKSRTLSQQGVRHTHEMGYYAKGKGKNGKTIYWAGTSENAALIGGIHPTESFNTSECGFEGSVDVRFRKIDLKENGDNFAATVNLSN